MIITNYEMLNTKCANKDFSYKTIESKGRKCSIKWNDQQVIDAGFTQQVDLLFRERQQTDFIAHWIYNMTGMRIKSDQHTLPARRFGNFNKVLYDFTMTQMD